MRYAATVMLAGCGLMVAACSASGEFSIGGESVDKAAENLISGDLADQIGLGEISAECDEVEDAAIGTTFACTGTTADGGVITYEAVVDAEDHINVESTNLVSTPLIEQALHESLTTQSPDVPLSLEGVDCGEGFVILVDMMTTCQVTPDGGSPQTATLTFADTSTGQFDFSFE